MRALITGGRGYIGENLAASFKDPIIFDKVNDWDVTRKKDVMKLMLRSDACFHLAAISGIAACEDDPVMAIRTNVLGTLNISKAAERCGVPLVFASSFAVHKTDNLYAMTKYLGEKIVVNYGGRVLRIANVYGGSNYLDKKDTVVARLMKGTFEDRGHGEEARDFIHIDEVCRAFLHMLSLPEGYIDLACHGVMTTIDELVEMSKDPTFPRNLRPDVRFQ